MTAAIETGGYTHGARWLEMSPAPGQMEAPVDPEDFRSPRAAPGPFQSPEVLGALAPAVHEAWRLVARKQGWTPAWDMPFADLPEDVKGFNRAAARRMPENLALVGLSLEPGKATAKAETAVRAVLERHMETLAEAEHRGWMAHLIAEGWTFGRPRDNAAKRHDCLRPYRDLSPAEKDKDRDSVRHYPDFARLAGFRVVGV